MPRADAGRRRQVVSAQVDLQIGRAESVADCVFSDEITQRCRKVQREKAKRTRFYETTTENNTPGYTA